MAALTQSHRNSNPFWQASAPTLIGWRRSFRLPHWRCRCRWLNSVRAAPLEVRVAAGHCLRFCNESALSFRFALSEVGHATRRAVARRPNFPRRWEMPKTVMIVEDHELNMKLFHDVLEAHGYHTICTRDGFNVLDLARKHHPDLILMDIQLPEVSGLEVTKWLKEDPELKAIPVVAVTAFAMKGDEERIRKDDCEAYLWKRISVPEFIETM